MRFLPAILFLFTALSPVISGGAEAKIPVRKPAREAPEPPQILKPSAGKPASPKPPQPKPGAEKPAAEKPAGKKPEKPSPAKTKPGKSPVSDPAPAPKVEWKPEYYKGRAYVPVEQVASYYDMAKPKAEGKSIELQNKLFRIEMTRGERRVRLNGWTFYLSFSIAERYGRTLVSVFDVRNLLDPIMRPNDRRDPAVLKTVVIDPAGGGKESGIKSPFIA